MPAANIVTLAVSDRPDRIEHRAAGPSRCCTRPGTRRITSASSIDRAASRSWATLRASVSMAATSCRRRRRRTSTSSSGSTARVAIEAWDPGYAVPDALRSVRPRQAAPAVVVENLAGWRPNGCAITAASQATTMRRRVGSRTLSTENCGGISATRRSLPYRVGAPFEVSWLGLARYWRKKRRVAASNSRRRRHADAATPVRVGSTSSRSAYPCGVPVAALIRADPVDRREHLAVAERRRAAHRIRGRRARSGSARADRAESTPAPGTRRTHPGR